MVNTWKSIFKTEDDFKSDLEFKSLRLGMTAEEIGKIYHLCASTICRYRSIYNVEVTVKRGNISKFKRKFIKLHGKEQWDYLKRAFETNTTYSEIAANLGLSKQRIQQIRLVLNKGKR